MAQTTPLLDDNNGNKGGRSSPEEGKRSSNNYGAAAAASSSSLPPPPAPLHPLRICCILSTAFCYGCTVTTMFLLVLPIECRTIELITRGEISKSVALGVFAAIAGSSQLVCPLVGMLSDRYHPRKKRRKQKRRMTRMWRTNKGVNVGEYGGDVEAPLSEEESRQWVKGRRMPYLLLGTALTEMGLVGIDIASAESTYSIFTAFFIIAMIGINVVYCVMIALIPDLVPHHQTGLANGTLALLLVSGSLFGFAMFKVVLDEGIHAMYLIYMVVMAVTCAVAFLSSNGLSGKKEEEEESSKLTGALSLSNTMAASGAAATIATKEQEEDQSASSLLSTLSALLSLGIIPTLHNMIYKPLSLMTWAEIRHAYWVDPNEHHDFFIVTLSRLFYYLGLSAQCFFLYFIHDVLHERENPEAAASMLAMVTTAAGAVTCYPVGIVSDRYVGGRRKPFVYGACAVLAFSNIALLWCTTIREMAGICATLGAANGVYLTMDTSLAVDTLDVLSERQEEAALQKKEEEEEEDGDGKVKDHKLIPGGKSNGAAQLLGVWGVAGFVGSALGPLVGGPLLYYFGSSHAAVAVSMHDDDQDDGVYSWEGYAVVLTLSACYFVCSAATLRWIRDHKL